MMCAAELVERRTLAPAVRHLAARLVDAPDFSFRPGQFVQFVLDPKTLRQFSIASLPRELPTVEFCVDISPGGKGSQFVEQLRTGARFSLRGPYGVFTVSADETRPLEFVATGAGISPLRAMIRHHLESAPEHPVRLTFGNRVPEDLLYHAEWMNCARHVPSFTYQPALSRPLENWAGPRGRVTDVLRERKDLAGRAFYLCGSPEMVDDCRTVLAEKGIPEADVHFEKFF